MNLALRPDRMRDLGRELAARRDDRAPWPAEWFATNDPQDAARCRALWGSVLLGCTTSALADRLRDERREAAPKVRQLDMQGGRVAFSWIGTPDFHTTAALAGCDGETLARGIARRLAEDGTAARLLADLIPEPGKRKTRGTCVRPDVADRRVQLAELRDAGLTVAEIVRETRLPRATVRRDLSAPEASA